MPVGTYIPLSSRTFPGDFGESPSKRQRTTLDSDHRFAEEQDQRYGVRSHMDQRGPQSAYPSRQPNATYGSGYVNGPQSAPSSSVSEYSFKHQRTQSSSTSSPYVSPRTEIPGYSSTAPNPFYQQQQQAREPVYAYQQNQPSDFQLRQAPQLTQPVVPFRQQQLPSQPQLGDSTAYFRALEPDDRSPQQHRSHAAPLPSQSVYHPPTSLLSFHERPTEIAQSRPQLLQPLLPNVLPPLQSTVSPGYAQAVTQSRSDYVLPSTETPAPMPIGNQANPERAQENYATQPADYRSPTYPKRDEG